MTVDYSPDDPVAGASRSSGTTEVQRWVDYADTIADADSRITTLDAAAVKLTGAQTVAGVKTFSSSPVIPAPTTDLQAATKKYVDDNASGGGSSLGGVIALHSFAAGADASLATTTSTSFADIDATNAAVSFTVPSSGSVLVEVSAHCGAEQAGERYCLNLREGASDIPGTNMRMVMNASGANPNLMRGYYAAVVTGLTASDAKTWKLGHAIIIGGGTNTGKLFTGPTFGPLTMKVSSLP